MAVIASPMLSSPTTRPCAKRDRLEVGVAVVSRAVAVTFCVEDFTS